ncbi:hypothetical protein [Pseudomonas sp.]|uniref:hypothetical protein n=1 Tax=Pseudomonas sp. TaxID=306 RepID=UPI003C70BC78
MHANPFAIPAPPVQATAPAAASTLPYAFMGLAVLVSLVGLLVNLVSVWLQPDAQMLDSYLEYLPRILTSRLEYTLLAAAAVLLLSRSYLERHAIAGFTRPPRQLLVGYFVMALVLSLGVRFIAGPLLSHLLSWAYEWFESAALAQVLVSEPINLLLFAFDTLLPLWLCLHLLRNSSVPGNASRVSRQEPALAFALCFAALYLKLLGLAGLLPGYLLSSYGDDWGYRLLELSGLLYAALVFAAARSGLPTQLARHNPGRLFLASLLCLLLWLLALALVAVALLLYVLSGSELFHEALLGLLGLGLLALLWPLTRLSLRWVYKPQAA